MRRTVLLLALSVAASALVADPTDQSPQLLLTPQLQKRLHRDRERQTPRWMSFESRVQSVPASPERGFELALYYAVTHDERRGREAVSWGLQHACERRQAALILDWCGDLLSPLERERLIKANCSFTGPASTARFRDELFVQIASGHGLSDSYRKDWSKILEKLQRGEFASGEVYAAVEYLMAVRATQHVDLRQEAASLFSVLPTEFLLAQTPEQVQHPDWQTHIAALGLVALDPNLGGSQYLQGWALEDAQTLREGPGVAYELLWANPYLPGVGYQNLDPWAYDPNGRLFARTDWSDHACWVSISARGANSANCPPDWQRSTQTFGHLTLIPMSQPCVQIPHRTANDSVIIWQQQPNQSFVAGGARRSSGQADSAGMWRVGANVEGKVCKGGAR